MSEQEPGATGTPEEPTAPAAPAAEPVTETAGAPTDLTSRTDRDYVLPVVHVHLPEQAVEVGYAAALAGSVIVGALDWPVVLLIGGGVLIARHRHRAGGGQHPIAA